MHEDQLHFLEDLDLEIHEASECLKNYTQPSALRRLLLSLTRAHWSTPDNHGAEGRSSPLACLTWNRDPSLTKLQIELDGTDEAKNADGPKIIVRVGNFRFRPLSTEGGAIRSEDNASSLKLFETKPQILFRHEFRDLDVAFDAAFSTFGFFAGQAAAISALIGDDVTLTPEVIGEATQVRGAPDALYRVDFGMEIMFNLGVPTVLESHRLKRVQVNTPL